MHSITDGRPPMFIQQPCINTPSLHAFLHCNPPTKKNAALLRPKASFGSLFQQHADIVIPDRSGSFPPQPTWGFRGDLLNVPALLSRGFPLIFRIFFGYKKNSSRIQTTTPRISEGPALQKRGTFEKRTTTSTEKGNPTREELPTVAAGAPTNDKKLVLIAYSGSGIHADLCIQVVKHKHSILFLFLIEKDGCNLF
ncbi:hypothetical protein CEXT_112831 [Caerostris extrusa]|uniref:Uncharacterized protein n=1 Tax=Caerostris extrusa TaxID=172846 RepID=A0AAV4QB86_CAEEX|nr:hypothetical protein CEXT_112831 [Caerostris extrusa]